MSTPSYIADAARRSYLAAGHPAGGLLHIVPVSGRAAPNVIELEAARAKKQTREVSGD